MSLVGESSGGLGEWGDDCVGWGVGGCVEVVEDSGVYVYLCMRMDELNRMMGLVQFSCLDLDPRM